MVLRIDEIEVGTGRKNKSVSVTENYVVADNVDTVFCDTTGGDIAVTLPAASDHLDRVIVMVKTDASGNQVTSEGQSMASQYASLKAQSGGTNWIPLL